MKAWIVREKDEFQAAVVFAETRGQAKMMALHTDACEDSDFLSIEARRIKEADQYYKPGKRELDWFNSEDRIAMVKDCGFTCIPDARCAEECEACPAKDYCDDYIFAEEGVLGGRDGSRKNEQVLQRLLLSGDSGVREYSLLRIRPENWDAEALSGGGRVYGEGAE